MPWSFHCFTHECKEHETLLWAYIAIVKLVFRPRSQSCNVAEWVTLGFDLFMCCEMPVLCIIRVVAVKNLFEILTFSFRKVAQIFHGFKNFNHDGILKSTLEIGKELNWEKKRKMLLKVTNMKRILTFLIIFMYLLYHI